MNIIFGFARANLIASLSINWPASRMLCMYAIDLVGLGNVRPSGHIQPARLLNVARQHFLGLL